MNTKRCQFWGFWRRKICTSWFRRLAACMWLRAPLRFWKSSPRLSRSSCDWRRRSGRFCWSKSATRVATVEVQCWRFSWAEASLRYSPLRVHCKTWRLSSAARNSWLEFCEPFTSCTRHFDPSRWTRNVSKKILIKFAFLSRCSFPEDSTQAYSRLDTGSTSKPKPSISKRTSMWFLNKAVPSISTQSLSKSLSKLNKSAQKEEVEKEWLLLGEPSSPVNRSDQEPLNAESSILSDATASDTECIVKAANSDSETSDEDIDSIVEEFQQKVKVSTAGLRDTNLKVPSMGSWRVAMLCIFSVVGSGFVAGISVWFELTIPLALSVAGEWIIDRNCATKRICFNYSCPGDDRCHAVDTALHLHTRHASHHNVHALVPLQCDSPLVDDVR